LSGRSNEDIDPRTIRCECRCLAGEQDILVKPERRITRRGVRRDDGIALGFCRLLREILRQKKWARAMLSTRGSSPALVFAMEFHLNKHPRARRAQRLLKRPMFIAIGAQRGGRISNTQSGGYGSRAHPRGICRGVCT